MRDPVAIVAPAIDIAQLERAVSKAHVALQDADRGVEAAERKTESLRQTQAQRRVELGRLLMESRDGFKRGTWLPFLEKHGIDERNARNWMALAGYVEITEPNGNGSDIPTRREVAGIDKPTRKPTKDPDAFHVLIASGDLKSKIKKQINEWPESSRQSIPGLLRDLADDLEREAKC